MCVFHYFLDDHILFQHINVIYLFRMQLQAELMSSKQVSVNLRNKTANFEKDIQV